MSIESGESGTLPGRLEFVREPTYFEVPTDPEWKRFSDRIASFTAGPAVSYARQPNIGEVDALDYERGAEDPSAEVEYHLQKPLVDGAGDPVDASADGILREGQDFRLPNTHTIQYRRKMSDGNFGAGIREYTIIRGAKIGSVEFEYDPTGELPVPVTVSYSPRKVRSYLVHQLDTGSTLDVQSSSDNDTMDLTIEDEGVGLTDVVTLNGTTTVTSTETFTDIDAVWLSDTPEGDVTITDGSGTTVTTLYGGLSHSDDGQAVDGERGIPPVGAGQHSSPVGSTFEHFVGDRLERPAGEPVRARVSSAGFSVDNSMSSNPVHSSRLPVYDEGERTISIDCDVAGKTVSHRNFKEHVLKQQNGLEHELDKTQMTFNNTTPTDVGEREVSADEAVTVYSVTFEASGTPALTITQP